jgi:hypothetical protein
MFGKIYWWRYVVWSFLLGLLVVGYFLGRQTFLSFFGFALMVAIIESIVSRIIQICREGTQPLRADLMLALGALAAFLGIPALGFWIAGHF